MIDHTGIDVSDAARSRRFYEQAHDPDGHNIEAVCHSPPRAGT